MNTAPGGIESQETGGETRKIKHARRAHDCKIMRTRAPLKLKNTRASLKGIKIRRFRKQTPYHRCMPWRRSTCDAFDGADDEMFAYLETCIGSTRACRIDAIDCVCLACPPKAGMHMRWTDHACNMINNMCVSCWWTCACHARQRNQPAAYAWATISPMPCPRAHSQTGMMMCKRCMIYRFCT